MPLDFAVIDYFLCVFATHFIFKKYDQYKSKSKTKSFLAIIENDEDIKQ